MSEEWGKLVERAEYYLAEGFIPRRDVRNVFRGLLTEATVSRDSVVNWRTLIWNIYDEEMGVDPKRIATCMNFINEHYEDCEASEDFEKQLNELLETEEEVLDKLEAVRTHLTKWVSGHSDWQMGRMSQWKEELVQILGESQT